MDALGLGSQEWDYLLVTDGSGSTWSRPCGWAAVLIHRSGWRKAFYGAFSQGTNNLAEMLAFLTPLFYLRYGDRFVPTGLRVVVLTDSRFVSECGSRRAEPKVHRELWQLRQGFARQGIFLEFRWTPRDTYDLNRFVDAVARQAAQSLLRVEEEEYDLEVGANFNPSLSTADADDDVVQED